MPTVSHQSFLGLTAVIVSSSMQRVLTLAERAARTDIAVLITGETGSGKEIVARAVHHYSLRCGRPWVDVNCGALPEHLMESELFGHERGAFSGAESAKPGLFELADTGTLFLDEVGELDPRMQVKLLRVLDGAPYFRLGGRKKIEVDTRIVAATNRDLAVATAANRFRSDLYYRLNQCPIEVPPLRERREDIVPLAEHFLRQHARDMILSAEVKGALARYSWPGNVRELRNAVTQAIVRAEGKEIAPHDVPCLNGSGKTFTPVRGHFHLPDVEREAILSALERTGGRHQKTADLLGISRRTLHRKLKLYRSLPEMEEHYA
jgi:DNA-binding NtrC family response regulator